MSCRQLPPIWPSTQRRDIAARTHRFEACRAAARPRTTRRGEREIGQAEFPPASSGPLVDKKLVHRPITSNVFFPPLHLVLQGKDAPVVPSWCTSEQDAADHSSSEMTPRMKLTCFRFLPGLLPSFYTPSASDPVDLPCNQTV